jgi:glycosyltransferase involved in cell wall biosynthesis
MKALLVSGFFPPGHIAGSEKRTYGYARTLLAEGNEVQVLCAGTWDQGTGYWNGYADDLYHGVPTRRLHLNWRLAPDPNRFLYQNPVIADRLEGWLREWRPDIVHVISCYTMSASVIEVATAYHIPVVLTLVDFWFLCPRLSLLHANGSLCDGRTNGWECLQCTLWGTKALRWSRMLFPEFSVRAGLTWMSQSPRLSRQRGLRGMALNMEHRKAYLSRVLQLADRVVAPSRVMRDMFCDAGSRQDIEVIHSGHDLGWLESMPPRQLSDVVRFGYVGQISSRKGVHILLDAFIAADLRDAARLDIYGDDRQCPGYADQLRERARDSSGTITFGGGFAHRELGTVLSNIDVLVVPSIWQENNPRVVQEAFAARVPVVGSDVGGISEFVRHEVNGLLFERGNVLDLARQMQRIIQEPALLPRLRAGVSPVKRIGQEMDELIAVYERLRGGKPCE